MWSTPLSSEKPPHLAKPSALHHTLACSLACRIVTKATWERAICFPAIPKPQLCACMPVCEQGRILGVVRGDEAAEVVEEVSLLGNRGRCGESREPL